MEPTEALALAAGKVDDELLLRNEYLGVENEILRSKIPGRVPMTDIERVRLAKLGKKLGRKALEGVAAIVKSDTILEWFRRLVAKKYTSSNEGRVGRPTIDSELEDLIVAVAMCDLASDMELVWLSFTTCG